MEFFDSHAHYNDEKFRDNRKEILEQIYNDGITKITCNGYNLDSSKESIEIANNNNFIYATVGISPNDVDDANDDTLNEIKKIANNKKVVAIGEIGLDYYWNKENKEKQKDFFIKQIQIADELNLPITIHCRDAVMDTLDILKNVINPQKRGIFHCCMLNKELIKEAVKLGFYISFSGNITYKNAKPEEAVNSVPFDRILIETDSPYLTPEPFRGQRNDSRNVKLVAQKIAQIKNMELSEIAKTTYENAKKIYNISD